MPGYWEFSWWWCVIPFLFMVLAMAGVFFFVARRGGCGCMGPGGGHERIPPRNPG